MKVMRIAILTITLACMLAVWPVCAVLRDTENRSGDSSHLFLEPLETGESVTQSFRPAVSRTEALDFVISYEEEQPREGELVFEFLDEEGRVLQKVPLQYAWIPNYQYYSIYLGSRIKTSGVYQYRLTNVSVTENLPVPVYTADPEMFSGVGCGMEVDGQAVEGELLTRYHWKQGLTMRNVLALWALLALAASAAWELLKVFDGIRNRKNRRDKTAL